MLIAALVYGIHYTQKNNKPVLNTFILATTFILIGYASYTMVIIRSNYDTLINENAPKDVMSFIRYLKREQYGSRPLLHGAYFTARPIDVKYGAAEYTKGKDKYEIASRKFTYLYEPDQETILPRLWNPDHKETYMSILGKSGFLSFLKAQYAHVCFLVVGVPQAWQNGFLIGLV